MREGKTKILSKRYRWVNALAHRTTLKTFLDDRGIKQKWLAAKVSMTPAALNLIVHGKTLPTLRSAQRIAKVLQTSVDELWPYEEDGEI